jgi:hypothetical protein
VDRQIDVELKQKQNESLMARIAKLCSGSEIDQQCRATRLAEKSGDKHYYAFGNVFVGLRSLGIDVGMDRASDSEQIVRCRIGSNS